MKESMSFSSPEQAIQYVVRRMEKENRAVSQRLIATETLIRFLIRSIEDVHPDIREALLTMIDGWHKGCLQQVEQDIGRGDLRSAFDDIASEMTKMVEVPEDQLPSFEVIPGGKDIT